jgi:hypothetical protein
MDSEIVESKNLNRRCLPGHQLREHEFVAGRSTPKHEIPRKTNNLPWQNKISSHILGIPWLFNGARRPVIYSTNPILASARICRREQMYVVGQNRWCVGLRDSLPNGDERTSSPDRQTIESWQHKSHKLRICASRITEINILTKIIRNPEATSSSSVSAQKKTSGRRVFRLRKLPRIWAAHNSTRETTSRKGRVRIGRE